MFATVPLYVPVPTCRGTLDSDVIRLGNDVAYLQLKPSANNKCT